MAQQRNKMFTVTDLLDSSKIEQLNKSITTSKNSKYSLHVPKDIKNWEELQQRDKRKKKNRKYRNRIPKKYETYIKSPWWEKRKNEYYKFHQRKCTVCRSVNKIHLHHKFYGKYYFEDDKDLIPLCETHHDEIHKMIGKVKKDMRYLTDKFISELQSLQ